MKRCKRDKLYRTLTRLLGSPLSFDGNARQDLFHAMMRWLGQTKKGAAIEYNGARYHIDYGRIRNKSDDSKDSWLTKMCRQSRTVFNNRMGHWFFSTEIKLSNSANVVVSKDLPLVKNWNHIRVDSSKRLTIAISAGYAVTVERHEVQRDGRVGKFAGRKVVQAIWDGRHYGDVQVWQCQYWDFTGLNNSADSWQKATQQQGYVAKTQTYVSVEPTFERAVNRVRTRTVHAGVRSILSDE